MSRLVDGLVMFLAWILILLVGQILIAMAFVAFVIAMAFLVVVVVFSPLFPRRSQKFLNDLFGGVSE